MPATTTSASTKAKKFAESNFSKKNATWKNKNRLSYNDCEDLDDEFSEDINKFGRQRINLLSNLDDEDFDNNSYEMRRCSEYDKKKSVAQLDCPMNEVNLQLPYPSSTTVSQVFDTSYMNPNGV